MFDIILLNIAFIITIVYFYKKTKNGIHMLQLESYKNERYYKWIKNNTRKAFPQKEILFVIPILGYILKNYMLGNISLILIIFIFIFTYKNEKQKKPLVVTSRVKRLYFTYLLVILLILILLNVLSIKNWVLIFEIIMTILSYYVIILINNINRPIENHIQKKFYKMAINKLKQMPNLKVVGITGSFGKTSTKYILSTILMQKYDVIMTPGSYNTTLGVEKTINENMKATNQIFICEMGAKNVGDIKEICDLVKPQYGIVTSIGNQHLETFKTIDNIKKTKMELIDSLPEDGVGFLNYDDENIITCKTTKNIVTYGLNSNRDFWVENIVLNEKGSNFTICSKDGKRINVKTKLLGEHNILNIVGATAIASKLGLSDNEIKLGVKSLKPVPHRLEMKSSPDGTIIIDDAYNSNVKGAKMALDVLNLFEDRQKILITPGIVDLGDSAYECNKNFGKQATEIANFIILVGEKSAKSIYDGIQETKYNLENVYIAKDLDDALNKMHKLISKKSVVLLENDLPDNYL